MGTRTNKDVERYCDLHGMKWYAVCGFNWTIKPTSEKFSVLTLEEAKTQAEIMKPDLDDVEIWVVDRKENPTHPVNIIRIKTTFKGMMEESIKK